jgi:predicted DNA-binding transcriptional regulator YafY
MARNAELIRQWEILREVDGARNGIAIAKLASTHGVHQRTIRRDMEALCKAGFPLYDDPVNGTKMWKLRSKPFRSLEETGLGVTELCALYFSRAMHDTDRRALSGRWIARWESWASTAGGEPEVPRPPSTHAESKSDWAQETE